jgi:O-antigen ligase
MPQNSKHSGAMGVLDARRWGELDGLVCAMLFIVAALAGGSSLHTPLRDMIVEMIAALALLYFTFTPAPGGTDRSLLLALSVPGVALIYLLGQLAPLPPSVWQSLPGRGFERDVMDAIGQTGRWMPISLNPYSTQRSALALLAPIAMLTGVARCSYATRRRLIILVVGCVAINTVLGLFQIGGGSAFYPYAISNDGAAVGLFSNKNHSGDFFLIGMLLISALLAEHSMARNWSSRLLAVAALLVFAISVAAANSRMALALLPFVLVICLVMVFRAQMAGRMKILALLIGALLVPALWLLTQNSIILKALARFDTSHEGRLDFWPDVYYAVKSYFPFGSGLGTFNQVYNSVESLTVVYNTYTVHAHNDYLEIALEMGLAGILVVSLGIICIAYLAWKNVLTAAASTRGQSARIASIFAIMVLMIHSIVDYPLRTALLSTLFAMLVAMLLRSPVKLSPLPPHDDRLAVSSLDKG